jgi:signal transduction histidine kinase
VGLESLRVRLGLFGFWFSVGLAETAKEWIASRARGVDLSIASELLMNLPWWLYWALATPLVFALSRRFDVTRPSPISAVLVHAPVAVLVAVGHLTLISTIGYFALVRGGNFVYDSLSAQFGLLAGGYFVMDLVFYGLIVATYDLLRSRKRLQEGQIRESRYRERAAKAENRAAEARLAALRMEINPHFLFNSLNAVGALVRIGDSKGATTMLVRLSELLRMTLRPFSEVEIPLARELDLLRRYLEIEQVRFGDRLVVEMDVPDDLLNAAVPPFLLQPLVENAMRHGVSLTPGPVQVRIWVGRTGEGRISLMVEDSGPGFRDLAGPVGTGLSNVEARLSELHGADAGLVLGSGSLGGASVEIQLPLRAMDREGSGDSA